MYRSYWKERKKKYQKAVSVKLNVICFEKIGRLQLLVALLGAPFGVSTVYVGLVPIVYMLNHSMACSLRMICVINVRAFRTGFNAYLFQNCVIIGQRFHFTSKIGIGDGFAKDQALSALLISMLCA